jgi:hypothetical protein
MAKTLRLPGLALLVCASLAHAWDRPEMAKYGSAYSGPELLQVYVAHNKADDHAVVKLTGINHPLDGHAFWTEVRYAPGQSNTIRTTYVIREKDAEKAIFFVNGSEGTLYLPNWRGQERAEIKLSYSRSKSSTIQPEHLLTDYARQAGKIE